MGYSMQSIGFWSDEIVMSEIESASDVSMFALAGQPIKVLGHRRLGFASLSQRDDNGAYILQLRDGGFIEFIEASA